MDPNATSGKNKGDPFSKAAGKKRGTSGDAVSSDKTPPPKSNGEHEEKKNKEKASTPRTPHFVVNDAEGKTVTFAVSGNAINIFVD